MNIVHAIEIILTGAITSSITILTISKKVRSWFKNLFRDDRLYDNIQDMNNSLDKLSCRMLRLEIINLIQNYPKNTVSINNLYDEYISRGGNSYIKSIYKEWSEKYN